MEVAIFTYAFLCSESVTSADVSLLDFVREPGEGFILATMCQGEVIKMTVK